MIPFIKKYLGCLAAIMEENRDYLIQLDSVVGDGDLGLTMGDGYHAAYTAVKDSSENDAGKLLYSAGKAMSTAVPSTMGTLMASGFMEAGKILKGHNDYTALNVFYLLDAYGCGVQKRGKAREGEKTFLDAFLPGVNAFNNSVCQNPDIIVAAHYAKKAADQGFEASKTMLAKHGRAAARGEASRNLSDPGAAVAVLMFQALIYAVED